MNFERFIPSAPKQPKIKITISTVDTNLEYEMEMSPSEPDTFINKLTQLFYSNYSLFQKHTKNSLFFS